jgi:hypothetical protein
MNDIGPSLPLRHALAVLAYRAAKVLRDFPPGARLERSTPRSRTPLELVAHLGDLLDWGCSLARGGYHWSPAQPATWDEACARFFAGLAALDAELARAAPESRPAEQIYQGPLADALTHVGQLALLRGMHGTPVRPESYARAEIRAGRVGLDQAAPRAEFDGDASFPEGRSR